MKKTVHIPVDYNLMIGTYNRKEPDSTNIDSVLGRVCSKDGGEDTPLNPASVELRAGGRRSMTTNVMTPIPKTNISCSDGKCHLKIK